MTEQFDPPLVKTIAILGGTGKEGAALAKRWALAGYKIIIGSRSEEKALKAASDLNNDLGGDFITGIENADAAQAADIVVLSVPYGAHQPTLESVKAHLDGKILIDVTVPNGPPNLQIVNIPEGQSAAQEAQQLLGENVRVVSAFQNVSYIKLRDPDADVECDVLVTGDDVDAKKEVITLVEAAGMKGVDAGVLANAVVAEALTSVLIHINKTYKSKHAGIRITGIE